MLMLCNNVVCFFSCTVYFPLVVNKALDGAMIDDYSKTKITQIDFKFPFFAKLDHSQKII